MSPKVVILGGGPAGVGAAWKLRHEEKADVVLLERNSHYGGNAGSFRWGDQWVDYGSHRLHPATEPHIMADIQRLLGDDLLDRPRHGRIRLLGKWIHFPLKPVDLFLRLDKKFALGSMKDMLGGKPGLNGRPENFATVLESSLGPTICEHFYFPYAVKLWGYDPRELSAIQAKKRVSASSFLKLAKKVMSSVPGFKPPGSGRFFYPKEGFGQISEAYAQAAADLGADLRQGWTVTGLKRQPGDDPERGWLVEAQSDAGAETLEADWVWSTIPITALARALDPGPPQEIVEAASQIDYRSMILIYLQVPVDQFTEYDAHYFPGADTRITRLQEPKNYSAQGRPEGTTVICAELPCSPKDDVWAMSDEELGQLVENDLQTSGIPLPKAPIAYAARKLPQAYPIYLTGYEEPFGALDAWIDAVPRVLSYGRQGLFAHDNTHHALNMAYAAVDCLNGAGFDEPKWASYRGEFAKHVVED